MLSVLESAHLTSLLSFQALNQSSSITQPFQARRSPKKKKTPSYRMCQGSLDIWKCGHRFMRFTRRCHRTEVCEWMLDKSATSNPSSSRRPNFRDETKQRFASPAETSPNAAVKPPSLSCPDSSILQSLLTVSLSPLQTAIPPTRPRRPVLPTRTPLGRRPRGPPGRRGNELRERGNAHGLGVAALG